jgi:hypothetical protein
MNAFTRQDDDNCQAALHARLAALNRARFQPGLPDDPRPDFTADLALEHQFLAASRAKVSARAAAAPRDPAGFVAWFENLAHVGPGQGHALFPWLATTCSLHDMRWFLCQEVAGEAGFEDLTALVQLGMPVRPKLELARNFWDEMGRGAAAGMHGPMLERLAAHLALDVAPPAIVWQSRALANTMAGLAVHRHYAYQAIGALGVIELTAPGRAAQVAAGLKRLGVPAKARHYFALHAVLDIKHSAAWNGEIISQLVAENPRTAAAIAEGALMRLECGAACFARYAGYFGS